MITTLYNTYDNYRGNIYQLTQHPDTVVTNLETNNKLSPNCKKTFIYLLIKECNSFKFTKIEIRAIFL